MDNVKANRDTVSVDSLSNTDVQLRWSQFNLAIQFYVIYLPILYVVAWLALKYSRRRIYGQNDLQHNVWCRYNP